MSDRQSFIDKILPMANQVFAETGVLPSVTIAQAIQETGGDINNILAQKNNFFGEKGTGDGGSIRLKTQEDYGNGLVWIYDNFKVYLNSVSGAVGRIKLLQQSNFKNVGKAKNFQDQVKLLKAGGYATDSNYVNALNNIYDSEKLSKYDTGIVQTKLDLTMPGDILTDSEGGLIEKSKDVLKDTLTPSIKTSFRVIIMIVLCIVALIALFKMLEVDKSIIKVSKGVI